jgi:hypothetical protein
VSGACCRRICVLLASAAAGFAAWKTLPGTPLDRLFFTTVARSYVNPPLFVSGNGSHEKPWSMRALSLSTKPDALEAPLIVALRDDPQGFFQSSPPAPIDLAVIFSNFQRLGAKKAASAAVLAWQSPDPIGLAALEKSLAGFESLVMAAPLSRGPVSLPLPPAFRRGSLPLSAIMGDTSGLPRVNRVPIPDLILGSDNSIAGFSVLESETPTEFTPLLAVWEDRVVIAFPLLTVLQRLNLQPADLQIRLGETLKLGRNGPTIAIDAYGRLITPLKPLAAYAEISAEALIDGGDALFPQKAPLPVILRDDQTAADPATRQFSKILAATVAAIASDQGMAPALAFPQLRQEVEIGLLAAVVITITLLCGAGHFTRNLLTILLVAACLGGQWLALGSGFMWLPGLAILAAILTMVVVSALVACKAPPLPATPLLTAGPEIIPQPLPRPKLPILPTVPPAPTPKNPAAKTPPRHKSRKKS